MPRLPVPFLVDAQQERRGSFHQRASESDLLRALLPRYQLEQLDLAMQRRQVDRGCFGGLKVALHQLELMRQKLQQLESSRQSTPESADSELEEKKMFSSCLQFWLFSTRCRSDFRENLKKLFNHRG